MPLANLNPKAISVFLTKQEKKANFLATQIPNVMQRQRITSDKPIPAATPLPDSLTATYEQVQYPVHAHVAGKGPLEKRRDVDIVSKKRKPEPQPSTVKVTARPAVPTDTGAILIVTPAQTEGQLVSFNPSTGFMVTQSQPAPAVPIPQPTAAATKNS